MVWFRRVSSAVGMIRIVVAVFLFGAAWASLPPPAAPQRIAEQMHSGPIVIAHRGASIEAPENTIPAFELALQDGADGWETDLRTSKDGVIVCVLS